MAKKIKIKIDSSRAEIIRVGMKTEFWQIILTAIEESKEYIQKQMDDGGMIDLTPEQYKFMNETFKAKKQYLDMLMKTPENLLSWLEKPPNERVKNFDPYEE